MNRDKILIEVFNDNFYKCFAASLAPTLVDEVQSELIVTLAEMNEEKLITLYNNKELKYYSIAIIRNMVLNKRSPFNKQFEKGLCYEDNKDVWNAAEEVAVIDFNDDAGDKLLADIYSFLSTRSKNVSGGWYDEKLFKMYFGDNVSFRDVSKKTGIPTSSIYHNIKNTTEIINNEFKTTYDGIRGE